MEDGDEREANRTGRAEPKCMALSSCDCGVPEE
jgi:hypothetical protein